MNCAACGVHVAPMRARGRGVDVCGCTTLGGTVKICVVRAPDGVILCDKHFVPWLQAARERRRWALKLWKQKKDGIILSVFAFGATARMFGVRPRVLKRMMTRARMCQLAHKRNERGHHDWATKVAIKKIAQENWERMDPWKRSVLMSGAALVGAIGIFNSMFGRRAAA